MKTQEEQAQTIANHMPSGRAFGAKNISGTNIRKFLLGLAKELIRVDWFIEKFRDDVLPDTTEFYLDEWESAVNIPDCCLDGSGDKDTRRRDIIGKLARMGIQTQSDFQELAAYFGVTIQIESGSVHGAFPFTFPIEFYDDERAAHHTIIITFSLPETERFPYEFPISFGNPEIVMLECIFNELKPANVNIIYRYS